MASVLTIITDSLKKLGVVSHGEALSAEESKDGLRALNNLLASWNNDSLIVNGVQIEEFTLTVGQSSYTLGTGGDFNSSAPAVVKDAFIKYSDNSEYNLTIIDSKDWGDITTKGTESTLPTHIFIDRGYPLRTVRLFPVPSEANTLILHSLRSFSSFTSLTDTVQLFEGCERALIYNLALELAPDYGKTPSQLVYETAKESLNLIMVNNNDPGTLEVDPFLSTSKSWDWRTGE